MSNFSESLALPHEHFVSVLLEEECAQVRSLPLGERCSFTQQTEDCRVEERIFDYMSFIYCAFGEKCYWTETFAEVVLVILTMYLFVAMGIVADNFFSGGLATLSKFLNFSENLAGVTLLAFGNGAPDIFAALVDPDRDSVMFVNEQLGCAVFMTCMIAGLIAIIKPFQVLGKNFIRDVIFLIVTLRLNEFNIADGFYQIEESIGMLLLYVVYLIVVVAMHYYSKRANSSRTTNALVHVQVLNNATSPIFNFSSLRPEILAKIDRVRKKLEIRSRQEINAEPEEESTLDMIKSLYEYLKNWETLKWFWKMYYLVQVPTYTLFLLVIPMYDFTYTKHGWFKPLNIINLLTLPQVVCVVFLWSSSEIFAIPIPVFAFGFSVVTILLVIFTSNFDHQPTYHWLFGFLNFIGSVVVIFGLCSEIVSLLNTFRIIFDLSDSIMGVTVLSLGKGIGDAVANITLAKQGYQRMAFAACFGGAIFNICLTLGLSFLSKALSLSDLLPYARIGVLGPNCTYHMYIILGWLLLGLAHTGFQARRSIGCFLVISYVIFMLQCILSELKLIHPMGTDHHNEEMFNE